MTTASRHRCRRARERAGLSLGQAAKLLGVTVAELTAAEFTGPYHSCSAERLADLYGVSVPWLLGECDQFDYAAVRSIPGSDTLWFSDRDEIAELLASLPRRPS